MKKSTKFILSKIALLILCLLIQFKSIGQKDTTILKNNDSLVVTTKEVAVFVTKDLLKLDILQKENLYLKQDTSLLSKQIKNYKNDSAINRKIQQGYLGAINNYRTNLENCEEYARKKDKQLAKVKFRSTASQSFLLIALIFLVTKL